MSDELLSTTCQIEWLRELQRGVEDRARREEALQRQTGQQTEAASTRYDETKTRLDARYAEDKAQLEAEYEGARRQIEENSEADWACVERQFDQVRKEITGQHRQATARADAVAKEARWEVLTVFDAEEKEPRRKLYETAQALSVLGQQLVAIEQDAGALMQARRQALAAAPSPEVDAQLLESVRGADLAEFVAARVDLARQALGVLRGQRLPQLFEGPRPVVVVLVAWFSAALPAGFLLGWNNWYWCVVGLAASAVAGVALRAWLLPKARRSVGTAYNEVLQRVGAARAADLACGHEARRRCHVDEGEILARRDTGLGDAEERRTGILREADARRAAETARAEETFPVQLEALARDRAEQLSAIDQKYPRLLGELAARYQAETGRNQEQYAGRRDEIAAAREAEFTSLAAAWRETVERFGAAGEAVSRRGAEIFPAWDTEPWPVAAAPPPAIRFGSCRLDLANIPRALSADSRLRPRQTVYDLPALLTLADHSALVLTTGQQGRAQAIALMQNVMLRFLTTSPPGKVRFTIVDPLGLGDNFSAFMHLADYDELLVSGRIWTESGHVEQQLARLTEYMENVLQKYLRSQYESIHQYNAAAGEVAEPLRVLAIADFPANITEVAARRLAAIIAGGARCGVYTILAVDRSLKMPGNLPLDDLTAHAVHLDWQAGKFRRRDPAMEHLPLAVDPPPPPDRFRQIVRSAGALAVTASRVEVPFASLAPAEAEIWTSDSGRELVVPIGRAAATRWQSVRLGRGTAQHLLVAGKTGAGKSTFLHALIISAALRYSPDQLRFYLIDFKKGVEFKPYATGGLPHANVIAIESEREFGLSVLVRLDGELRQRGDLYRHAGAQDLAAFRQAEPATPMPRILLVVDEFQELFVEDDKLAQDASLLLDRLVRQGRAFGIHVVLGSQTLAGAYSLARSTLGQMAIRVALQCSEADAHLILSEENPAARLLSRPGEAIYNDQNGLVAGNNPFQVVWLSEPDRQRYVEALGAKHRAAGGQPPQPIVFEGNAPADIADNHLLARALTAPADAADPPRAWLGAAVQIKDPTAATFRRQGGSNLLLVGQQELLALGMMTAAMVGLAASGSAVPAAETAAAGPPSSGNGRRQHGAPSRFFVLDGMHPDAADAGHWQRLAECLPATIAVGGTRDAAALLAPVAAIVRDRAGGGDDAKPPVYLFVYHLGRFRDLRRQEDDFSFSARPSEQPATPAELLREILQEGPACGVHTIVWADSYNSVQRALDRAALREVSLRVVLQSSATDSSSLIDTPAASRLGPNRAYFYCEDDGGLEKFRPYAPPRPEWLARIARDLATRAAVG